MQRAARWIAYATLAWLVVNALAYPISYLVPKGRGGLALAGTPLQNFNMVLLIGFIIVCILADVVYVTHLHRLKDASPAGGNVVVKDLVGTIVEFDYPLFITALLLLIEIIVIYMIAF